MRKVDNLTGLRFGRWFVIGPSDTRGRYTKMWLCRCDCGKEKPVQGGNLKSGKTVSCGCYRNEVLRDYFDSRCPLSTVYPIEYGIHGGLMFRSRHGLPGKTGVHGERPVGVCELMSSFAGFMQAMGPRPAPKMSVDRIDNEGGYWCGTCQECVSLGRKPNCRWATAKQQCNNRRNNFRIEVGDECLTASEWADRTGVSSSTIIQRIRTGWDPHEAVYTKNVHQKFRRKLQPITEDQLWAIEDDRERRFSDVR